MQRIRSKVGSDGTNQSARFCRMTCVRVQKRNAFEMYKQSAELNTPLGSIIVLNGGKQTKKKHNRLIAVQAWKDPQSNKAAF